MEGTIAAHKEVIPHKIVFSTIIGSQAYGTNVEGSDVDIKGVYVQDAMDLMTYGYKPQIEVSKDEVYFEIRRFIELLASANPTVLEMLYSPEDCILLQEPEFAILLKYRDEFLTKKCANSFSGYAFAQIKKAKGLDKKINWEDGDMVRKTPLDFCYIWDQIDEHSVPLVHFLDKLGIEQEYCGLTNINNMRDCHALYVDWDANFNGAQPFGLKGIAGEDSNALRLSSIPVELIALGVVYYNKDGYTQHCRKYKEYTTWLAERNVQRYVDIEEHGQKIDGKNMLHCMRLIFTAIEIAETGFLRVRRTKEEAEYLISIRKGKVSLEDLLNKAEENVDKILPIFSKSELPDTFTDERRQEILTEIRKYQLEDVREVSRESE